MRCNSRGDFDHTPQASPTINSPRAVLPISHQPLCQSPIPTWLPCNPSRHCDCARCHPSPVPVDKLATRQAGTRRGEGVFSPQTWRWNEDAVKPSKQRTACLRPKKGNPAFWGGLFDHSGGPQSDPPLRPEGVPPPLCLRRKPALVSALSTILDVPSTLPVPDLSIFSPVFELWCPGVPGGGEEGGGEDTGTGAAFRPDFAGREVPSAMDLPL